jgi:uncharacterized protein YjdB
LKAGTAVITAKSSDGKVSAKCTITVTDKKQAVEIRIPIFEKEDRTITCGYRYWAKWIKTR